MLDGRVVAITGAGGGLGRAYALAAAEAGASLVINDVDSTAADATVLAVRARGGSASALVGSVAATDFGDQIVAECLSTFGRIDGLVNNAGVLSPGDPLEQPGYLVQRTVEINFLGSLRCGVAAMRAMRARGSGAIVNVVSGAIEGSPGLSLYGATKAGMMGATYGWALELEGSGVRVNAISPLAHTAMSDQSDNDDSLKGGDPERVAPLVVYLLSDRSRALNGQIIRFDGRRLGVVAEPRVIAISPAREWTPELVEAAFDGGMSSHLRAVGLAAAQRAEHVDC